MAQPITITKSKDHRRRKNPRSAELFAHRRHETNAARPKQERIESIFEVGDSKHGKIIGPFRD